MLTQSQSLIVALAQSRHATTFNQDDPTNLIINAARLHGWAHVVLVGSGIEC